MSGSQLKPPALSGDTYFVHGTSKTNRLFCEFAMYDGLSQEKTQAGLNTAHNDQVSKMSRNYWLDSKDENNTTRTSDLERVRCIFSFVLLSWNMLGSC